MDRLTCRCDGTACCQIEVHNICSRERNVVKLQELAVASGATLLLLRRWEVCGGGRGGFVRWLVGDCNVQCNSSELLCQCRCWQEVLGWCVSLSLHADVAAVCIRCAELQVVGSC
eukprot:4733322-Amphidinium_carterae.1